MLFRNGHLSYWGIRAVAETTRVDPGMFDCMCGHVHLQAGWIYISFIAIRALVRLVLVVLTAVRLEERPMLCGWEERKSKENFLQDGKRFFRSEKVSCIYWIRAERKSFTPVDLRVEWRTSHSQDDCTCMAYHRCGSWWTSAEVTPVTVRLNWSRGVTQHQWLGYLLCCCRWLSCLKDLWQ